LEDAFALANFETHPKIEYNEIFDALSTHWPIFNGDFRPGTSSQD
jgi:hypothetical protein